MLAWSDLAVSGVHGLYQRFRVLIQEGFKFLVVGGIGTVMTIVGAVALHALGKYMAVTIATIAATIFSFLGNRYWTFGHRQGHSATQESAVFFLLNGVGLLIYYGCIWVIQDLMRLESRTWYAVALVIGTGLGTVFRFWSYRKWVWKIQQQPRSATAGLAACPEPALAVGASVRAIQAGGPMPRRWPPGQAPARHAAPRRALDLRSAARGRHGAHRRT